MAASLRSRYAQDVAQGYTRVRPAGEPVRAEDLTHLPGLLQTYLQRMGTLGQPRLQNFRVTFQGAMRRTRTGRWMAIQAEQHTFLGPEPARYFLIRGRQFGLPFEGYHRFAAGQATMQVRVASLLQVVDAQGPEMDRSETVTFFNDLCLLAPAGLLDVAVRWTEAGARDLVGTLHHQGQTVTARLSFDAAGDLADFRSEDRSLSSNGTSFTCLPWSTPVRAYMEGQERRWMHQADAIWHEPEGAFPYARFEVADIAYNQGLPEPDYLPGASA